MTGAPTPPGYKVLRPLTADGGSEAFVAEGEGFSSPVQLRIVGPALAGDGPRMEQFLAEAQRLTGVASPTVATVLSCGRLPDGRVFVVTDFAESRPLDATVPLPLEALVELGTHLAMALEAVHAAGVVFGPLTAAQVQLTAHGPRLDAAHAALLRPTGATADGDVQALVQLLQTLGGPAGDNHPFDAPIRKGLREATSLGELLKSFVAVRQRWGGDTRVSPVKAEGPKSRFEPEVDLTGRRLGPYQLHQLIGEGAMGRVYLGKHHRIGREAAIKVLRAEHARDKDLVQRFIQEATAVSAIKNEHIVEVHDFGEEPLPDGSPLVYCVMEVLHGRPLSVEIKAGRMGVQRGCRIAHQVVRALGAAHALGVVHRDVKPENIFLHQRDGDTDYVKVLDFGVAKLLKPMGDMPTSTTQAGMIIGTPDYMSPEQAMGISTDLRADLYAVGLVLYELFAGTLPFRGNTFGQLVVEITTRPPPPLPERAPNGDLIPPALAEVISRCLAKKPEDRWQNADALATALEPFALRGNTHENLPKVGSRPGPGRLAAIAGLALVVLAGAGWFAFRAPAPTPIAAVVTPPTVAPVPVVPAPDPTPVVVAPVPAPIPAPTPVVTAPVVKPQSRLTSKDVARAFAGSQKQLRSCLTEHRKLLPSKEGQLMLSFTVLNSGTVSKARVMTPGFEGVIDGCVVTRLKTLRFPRTLEPEVTFELPLAYVFKD